jgi:cysteinyl-tRNA synthetase
MESSATAFKNLVHSLRRHPEVIGIDNSVIQAFELHMNDDFNTPEVCALLFRCKKLWNSTNCSILGNTILLILETLGFNFETNLSIKEIEELIFERANCKLEGNFSRADEIRGHLAHHDVFLSDVGSKTHWYIKK